MFRSAHQCWRYRLRTHPQTAGCSWLALHNEWRRPAWLDHYMEVLHCTAKAAAQRLRMAALCKPHPCTHQAVQDCTYSMGRPRTSPACRLSVCHMLWSSFHNASCRSACCSGSPACQRNAASLQFTQGAGVCVCWGGGQAGGSFANHAAYAEAIACMTSRLPRSCSS